MATAKKLPSGSWRVQVFSHYETKNGKKVPRYKSFTSKDPSARGRREAEQKAAEWAYTREERPAAISIADAVERYLVAKEGVLSPASVRAYRSYQRNHFDEIGSMMIHDVNKAKLQLWVSALAQKLQPKTVKEIVMLLSSVYHLETGRQLDLTIPSPSPKEQHTPSDAEVKALLESVAGTDLEIAISLSAFCSLRRGEICALTSMDIHDGFIFVSRSVVRDQYGDWVTKEPKTPGSVRAVPIPERIQKMIAGKNGKIVAYTPDKLTKKFIQACKRAGLQFRFHDLRHYYASTAHYLGVPDAYIMANGGWISDSVMKRVYREALQDKRKEENDKIMDHMSKILG